MAMRNVPFRDVMNDNASVSRAADTADEAIGEQHLREVLERDLWPRLLADDVDGKVCNA